MAIELYFSNQLDQLAEKFSAVLTSEIRGKSNILEPTRVIVPNANLAKWLQLFLAGKNAIFMNVDFQYLEAGLWEMLAALDPADVQPDRMDKDGRQILLLHALQTLDPGDPAFLPISRYLFAQSGAQRPDTAARLWQLSEKLAHLFEEYEFHRTDMIRQWAAGTTATPGAMEVCQQRLYARLKTVRDRLAQRTDRPLLSTMEYADRVLSQPQEGRGPEADLPSVHFFGLSQISSFHLTLVGRLQDFYAIHIYTMNPCEEFWEDVKTPGEKRWIRRRNVQTLAIHASEADQGELFQPPDNALLAAWGKPGRESVRLLCQLTDYDFNACFAAARQPAGVLQRVQNDILTLSAAADRTQRLSQDRSLQIIACPSLHREVETVFNSILFNLAGDDTLQLTDIAILVPDMSAYKPAFDAVFNRRPGQIAYNLVDSHAEIESIYGQAVLAILELAGGRFSRSEVFALILNPCFMSRWKIGPDEVSAWVSWTRALNIFHDFDSQSKADRGYPAGGSFTWQQGLERLRLSRIMAAPDETDPAGFVHYQGRVPFADLNTGDADLVEKFCLIIESLHQSVGTLNRGRLSGAQWKERFFKTCDQLLDIPEDFRGEAVIRKTLLAAFDRLELYDRLPESHSPETLDIDLDIALIREFVRSNLGAVSGGHGNYLTGGVTISSLQPMRPIPFRIVYVLGMQEGYFPGRPDHSTLDLRQSRRRIGDISLPERNCYLFLEMLLSVREKLYLGYIARDLQKDRLQQPCSVVNQLKRYVEQEILAAGQSFRVAQVPLTGSSLRYLATDALSVWSDAIVNDSLADRVACYRIHGSWPAFRLRASAEDLQQVARFEPDFSFDPPVLEVADRSVQKITLRQLAKFLEDPVRQKIQRHLGLYDEEETIADVVLRADEPFFSEFPLDYRLKLEPLRLWIDARLGWGGDQAGAIASADSDIYYQRVYAACRREGLTPEGAFADIDRDEIRAQFHQIVDTLDPLIEQMAAARQLWRGVIMGDPGEAPLPLSSRSAVKRFEPLCLTAETRTHAAQRVAQAVELHGQWPWVWLDNAAAGHMLVLTGSAKSPAQPDKYVLAPLLFYLMNLVGDESRQWLASTGMTLHVVYRETIKEWTYRCDPDMAAVYLKELMADLLDQSMTAWLPFDVATSRKCRPQELSEDEINDFQRMVFAAEMEEAFGEQEDYLVNLARPAIPADALDRVRRRFMLFFDRE